MQIKRNLWITFVAVVLLVVSLSVPVAATEDFAIVKLEQKGTNYVYIEWTECDGADGYSLYRSEEGAAFVLVKHISSCTTYNYSLKNGTNYAYQVRPYVLQEDGSKHYLTSSESAEIQLGVKTPQNLQITTNSKTSMSICWEGDRLADYYMLYRSTDNNTWSLVKRVYGVSTTTYGLQEGQTYFFRVKAVRNVGGVDRYSDYSDSGHATLGMAAPGFLNVTRVNSSSVELEWESVPGATGYRLYRSENGGDFRLIKTVTGTTTKNYSLNTNVTYTYSVAAIMETGGTTYKSQYTYSTPVRLALEAVENLRIEDIYASGIKLSWDPVAGATGYRLYRNGKDEAPVLVKTVTDTSTNTYGLTDGQCYGFSVKPVLTNGAVTINGPVSEEVQIFFTDPPEPTVVQQQVNRINIHWDAVTDADQYRIHILSENGEEVTREVTGTALEYDITNANAVTVSLWAVKDGVESYPASGTIRPVYEAGLTFSISQLIDQSQISLAWEPVDGARRYEVQRLSEKENDFISLGVCEETSYLDTDGVPGEAYMYRYRAEYTVGNSTFWGNWSESVTVDLPEATRYRALLIGQENYATVLHGPQNDLQAMRNMLSGMTEMNWSVVSQADATREEMVGLINLAFSGATENDVSLFYYSGHGVTQSGDYYAGALVTVDYNYIPMEELAQLLSAIPGKVVVILDSCGSGAGIYDGPSTFSAEGLDSFDPSQFNTQVIQTFAQYGENFQDKTGELAGEKFYVLTSSAYEQNSRSICINNVWGGVFTRAFVGSAGYDFNSQTWDAKMPADKNGDNCVTLQECYLHCQGEASQYQDVQVYPAESSVRLLFK